MVIMEPYKKTESLKALIQSATGKAANWNVIVYRAVGTEYANKRDLLSGEGTKRFGGRWTPPGSFATAHASLDVRTAVAESLGTQQQYGIAVAARLPLTLVAIDVSLQKLHDLTDDSILRELDLTRQRLLRCRWRENMDKGREAIRVIHQHGQTFVTWSAIAPGEDGAKCRYSLYRSDRPITAQNLKQAELCYQDILNNSARLFGTAFNIKDRLDPKKPY